MAAESDEIVATFSTTTTTTVTTTATTTSTTTTTTSNHSANGTIDNNIGLIAGTANSLNSNNNSNNGSINSKIDNLSNASGSIPRKKIATPIIVGTTPIIVGATPINTTHPSNSSAEDSICGNNNNINNNKGIDRGIFHNNSKYSYRIGNPSYNFYHAPPDRGGRGISMMLPEGDLTEQEYEEQDRDDEDGLGPLPIRWEKAFTENGETYFIDHNTGTSHWLDPRLSKFQKKSLEDCLDDELPYGWEKIHDPQYGTYFIDHVNRRTQYENPVLEAKRRAERNRSDTIDKLTIKTSSMLGPPPPPPPTASSSSQKAIKKSITRTGDAGSSSMINNNNNDPHTKQNNIFTRNPAELYGERITTTLLKSSRGLGLTIVGGDDTVEEFLQIKSIVPNGPAWLDGKLMTGDILVYVNDICVLGFTHHEMVNVFQSILAGETVTLEVCRGYPLPFYPDDPNTEVVTTIAVDSINADPNEKARILMDLNMDGNYNFLDDSDGIHHNGNNINNDHQNHNNHHHHHQSHDQIIGNDNYMTNNGSLTKNSINKFQNYSSGGGGGGGGGSVRSDGSDSYINDVKNTMSTSSSDKPEIMNISIVKGPLGFGFTIADSAYGQKVKKILDRNCCKNLIEGDYLLAINNISVKHMSHSEVVQVLKNCPKSQEATLNVQRGQYFNGSLGSGTGGGTKGNRLRRSGDATRFGIAKENGTTGGRSNGSGLFRSKTPTADLYSTQQKEILPIRPKTPLVDTRNRVKTPTNDILDNGCSGTTATTAAMTATTTATPDDTICIGDTNSLDKKNQQSDNKSNNSFHDHDSINNDIPYMDPLPKLVSSLSERLAETSISQQNHHQQQQQQQIQLERYRDNQINNLYHPIERSSRNKQFSTSQSDINFEQPIEYFPYNNINNNGNNINNLDNNDSHQNHGYISNNSYNNNLYSLSPPLSQVQLPIMAPVPTYHQDCFCYECQEYGSRQHHQHHQQQQQQPQQQHHEQQQHQEFILQSQYHYPIIAPAPNQSLNNNITNGRIQKRINDYMIDRRKTGFSPLEMVHGANVVSGGGGGSTSATMLQIGNQSAQSHQQQYWKYGQLSPGSELNQQIAQEDYAISKVTLERQALGFGFRIVGGTEQGSQVTVGHIVPGGSADRYDEIATGDEILSIDGHNVVQGSHHRVVQLMGEAAHRGHVTMVLRRKIQQSHHQQMQQTNCYPYDVIVNRSDNEGFGFVIISSCQYYGSTIGNLIKGSPADRCGHLNIGDRIIAVNRIDISNLSHGDIVNLIKESGLHVRLTIGNPNETIQIPLQQQSPTSVALSQQQQQQQQQQQIPIQTVSSTISTNNFERYQQPTTNNISQQYPSQL